ncbi:MAG: tol-pal system protein YbgF [Syntrophobacterales bacterium]|nr:MAG: tol-pal system protein YbgF [Syntrophobacterales bacterium]
MIRKRSLRILLAAGFLAIIFGCTTTGDMAYLRQDIDSLYRQLIDVQKELKQLRSESSMTIRKSQADLDFMLEPLQREIQILKNAVEENREFAQRPQQELTAFRRDFEIRLNELEGELDKVRKEMEAKLNEISKASRAQIKKEPTSKGEPSSLEAMEALYKEAKQTYERKEFSAAREKFRAFLAVYPKTELSDNAHFWIGECHYSVKNYEKAIIAYDDVVKKFPKGDKVPSALLKQALCWLKLGDKTFAQSLLNQVIREYPRTQQAKIAKQKLKRIQ